MHNYFAIVYSAIANLILFHKEINFILTETLDILCILVVNDIITMKNNYVMIIIRFI